MSSNVDRIEILRSSAENRQKEVMIHQINIDNYKRAIEEIDNNHVDLHEFRNQLSELLKTSEIEQRKEKIILKVIMDQLEECPCTSS